MVFFTPDGVCAHHFIRENRLGRATALFMLALLFFFAR